MTQRFPLSRGLVGLLIAPLLVIGCSKTKTETKYVDVVVTTPTVSVSGAEFVIITGNSIGLTATTQGDETDAAYTWTSSDATVATVTGTTPTVQVKGLKPGNAIITATGQTTGAIGKFNVVVAFNLPEVAEWSKSGHAAVTSDQFTHWLSGDGLVDAGCVRCHSSTGFVSYLETGATNPAIPDLPQAPNGEGVNCKACHSAAATELSQVTFPSGVQITGLGAEARCMTCHQGRESTVSLDTTIAAKKAAAGVTGDDELVAGLGFVNGHYFPAAATLYGGVVKGAYQFAGKAYDVRFRHVPGYDSCLGCHDQHSLEVKVDACATCHTNVTGATYEEKLAKVRDIRMQSSGQDYDGDANVAEGIAGELETLRTKVLATLNAYAAEKSLGNLCYSGATYPYFFKSVNTDGTCATGEAASANKYTNWTVHMVQAAYNFQYASKDPGAFAHNAKYVIEVLSDSIEALNSGMTTPVSTAGMVRNDFGHFNGAGEPARHWSQPAGVEANCSKCHGGAAGYDYYLANGTTTVVEAGNGLDCATCHTSFEPFPTAAAPNLEAPASVVFPSTKTVAADATTGATKIDTTTTMCATCHSGREAKSTVDAAIAAAADGGNLSFKNVHYLAAGAMLLGSEAGVGYEFGGKTYQARTAHAGGINCNFCHNGNLSNHTFSAPAVFLSQAGNCGGCHADAATVEEIRDVFAAVPDLDGDANTTETLASEIEGLREKLAAQMGAVADICYAPAVYPYFHIASTSNGCTTASSATKFTFKKGAAANQTALYQAAFNLQFATKDPGAWAHNWRYTAQLLIDSTEALGGDVSGLTRP